MFLKLDGNTALSCPLLEHPPKNRDSPEKTLPGRETLRLESPGFMNMILVTELNPTWALSQVRDMASD